MSSVGHPGVEGPVGHHIVAEREDRDFVWLCKICEEKRDVVLVKMLRHLREDHNLGDVMYSEDFNKILVTSAVKV